MGKLSFIIFTLLLAGSGFAKPESISSGRDSKKEEGFLLYKSIERDELKPVVDPKVYSVLEVGTRCEVVSEQNKNGKYEISVVLKYRLCQKVDYYKSSDITYLWSYSRKNVHTEKDYVLTKYEEQSSSASEKHNRVSPKVFYVGRVGYKNLEDLKKAKEEAYANVDSSLSDIARDEDILVNLLNTKKNECQAFIEKLETGSTQENFCK